MAASDTCQTWNMNPGQAACMQRLYGANASSSKLGCGSKFHSCCRSPREVCVCFSDASGLADEAVLRARLMPCRCLMHRCEARNLLRLSGRSAGSMSLASFSAQLEDANAVLNSEQTD